MLRRGLLRAALALGVCAILFGAATALSASNSVQATHVGRQTIRVDPNALKPTQCATVSVTAVLICPRGGGTCSGADASELILGSPNVDDIAGGKGNDCILGGSGNDALKGDQGTDICIGGPGTDSFHPSCETQIQ